MLKNGVQQQTAGNIRKYEKDTVIVAEGTRSDEMFILLQGGASVYKNHGKFNQQEITILRLGGFYGENCLFLNRETTGSLVATSDSVIMAVNEKNYAEAFSRQPDLAFSMIGQLVRRLDSANKTIDQMNSKDKSGVIDTGFSKSELFPPTHGAYTLALTNEKSEFVFKNAMTCPLCGAKFETLSILTSRLRREGTDRDLRVRYIGVEPMHYDIVSCPECLYSAPVDIFPNAARKFENAVRTELGRFAGQGLVKPGMARDSATVFAGYYLAIRSVPICFDEFQTIVGGLWQKLSRLYMDVGNEELYLFASDNAAKNYDNARNFFYQAKINRQGTPVMVQQADRRLEDIKELMKK
jgi:uncharacterized protein (DUF2225 family)